MNDKELADRIVALGFKETNWLSSSFAGQLSEHTYVRDWRVAGALMEKVYALRFAVQGVPIPDIRRVTANFESLPRAICEACVEALTE